jgi:hypothetical protein
MRKSLIALLILAGCERSPSESGVSQLPAPTGDPIASAPIAASDYEIAGPFAHENLSVYLLSKKGAPRAKAGYLTLEEGLTSGALKVTEKAGGAEVNELEIENVGERPVYLQAGDTVKGGQQDRTIGVDFLLKPKSGKTTIDAFCVEPGRWAGRAADFPAGVGLAFSLAEAPAATKEQKLAIKESKDQGQVWDAGRRANSNLSSNSGSSRVQDSYVLAAEDPKVKEKTDAAVKALIGITQGKEGLVGMAFAINGDVNSAEIYADPELFSVLWPKLLKSAALEALEKKAEKASGKTASSADIQALLQEAGSGDGRVQTISGDLRMKTFRGKSVTLFDTEKDGALLHRQVLKR